VSAPVLIDAHCHLDELSDPIGTVSAARREGVVIVAVTQSPSKYRAALARFGGMANVRVALGLHPLYVARATARELAAFAQQLASARYVGEVGLDRSPDGLASWERQLNVFEQLLQASEAPASVWSVHTRRAESVAVPLLIQAGVPAVLHWYAGSLKVLEQALQGGLYVSVNPAMLISASGQRVVEALPKERVLTETDAPYVGGDGPPIAIAKVIAGLARRWRTSPEEAGQIVFDNMARLAAARVDAVASPREELRA